MPRIMLRGLVRYAPECAGVEPRGALAVVDGESDRDATAQR